jgi:hypothetical protein
MRNTDRTAGPGKSGRVLWTFFLAVIMAASPSAFGQVQTPSPGVDTLLAAIVGVRAQVPEVSRTAQALGTQRV